MTLAPSLRTEIATATSVFELAHRLGSRCLEHSEVIKSLWAKPAVSEVVKNLEYAVAAVTYEELEAPPGAAGLDQLLALHRIEERLALAEVHSPIEYLAVLRGLCHVALPHWFLASEACLKLEPGMPVELVSRRINDRFDDHTPSIATINRGTLLDGHPYVLFERRKQDSISVELDYSDRDRLDELTWTGEDRLPRIATLHPVLGEGGIDYSISRGSGTFFDVCPKRWDPDAVLARLRQVVGEAEIAVLPELCMPGDEVAAFGDALRAEPRAYPPIVVAGSAHVERAETGDGLRVKANESRVYLDGRLVLVQDKVHPFATKMLGTTSDGGPLEEGITKEPKTLRVLSGEHTRLAVSICSDLNGSGVPWALESVGVNLLLVPSMTLSPGSFNGALCGLASRCQGVAVVVNADLDALAGRRLKQPFRVMAAVPRVRERDQSRSYPSRVARRRSLGVLDVNRGLRRAMHWFGP